ncbi:hypothetical protein OH77DRAFT_1428800 [Trametes cingulata]|nr:hypothetical protein OH77DRAFT_1428800 [Trametes cingulata]
MVWRTYFTCERVDYSTADNVCDSSQGEWQPARVYLSEATGNIKWILVTVNGDERNPVIWHTIKDGWTVTCEEETLTLQMRRPSAVGVPVKVDRLRFSTRADFWSFTAHFSFGRVQSSGEGWSLDFSYGFPNDNQSLPAAGSSAS